MSVTDTFTFNRDTTKYDPANEGYLPNLARNVAVNPFAP